MDITINRKAQQEAPRKNISKAAAEYREITSAELARIFGEDSPLRRDNGSDGALTVTGYQVAVSRVSEALASLPINIGQDESHPVRMLLKRRPNPQTSGNVFKAKIQTDALIYGNGYAEIERNNAGDPIALWQLDPTRVVRKAPSRLIDNYQYTPQNGGEIRTIEARNMFHIMGFTLDGYTGVNMIEVLRNALDRGVFVMRFGRVYFKNYAKPSLVVSVDDEWANEEDIDSLAKSWRERNGGDGAGGTAVVPFKVKVDSVSSDADKAQLVEAEKQVLREFLRVYGVPPVVGGDFENANYSNSVQQYRAFATVCLRPWTERWASEIESKLLSDADPSEVTFALHEWIAEARTDYYKAALNNQAWLTADEVRDELGRGTMEIEEEPAPEIPTEEEVQNDDGIQDN